MLSKHAYINNELQVKYYKQIIYNNLNINIYIPYE